MQKTLTSKIPAWTGVATVTVVVAGMLWLGVGGLTGAAETYKGMTESDEPSVEQTQPVPVAKPILTNAPLADAR